MLLRKYVLNIPLLCLMPFCLASCVSAQPQSAAITNTSFETGGDAPDGWTAGGSGQTAWEDTGHTGGHSISVSASAPNATVYWADKSLALKPHSSYRLSFWSKDENSSEGAIISGFDAVNHDFAFSGPAWTQHSFVFVTPDNTDGLYLRLGQWNGSGKVFFDDVSLQEVTPIQSSFSQGQLGEGEHISNNVYSFNTSLDFSSNYARTLQSVNAGFNTNRWIFGDNTQITYRHQVGSNLQKNAKITANISYYKGGQLILEASRDGQSWQQVTTVASAGRVNADLPASLFPANTIYVRLRAANATPPKGDSSPGSFQINDYGYTASLASTVPDVTGKTTFVAVEQSAPSLQTQIKSLGSLMPGASSNVELHFSTSQSLPPLKAVLTLTPPAESSSKALSFTAQSKGGGLSGDLKIPYQFDQAGNWNAQLQLFQDQKIVYTASADFNVASLYASNYGERVEGSNDLWWCGSAYKVWRERPLPPPSQKSASVPIKLARNEYEAVQIVAKPQKDISNVTVVSSDLTGPGGAKLDSKNITIDQVGYVPVEHPSDALGSADLWPDPLPPLSKTLHLKAGENQPFWITAYAPANIPAGEYNGVIHFAGDGWKLDVPLSVTVWDFTLSQQTHVKSAFGLTPGYLAPYYNVSGDGLGKVMDQYYANFEQHRISPYDPLYGAPIKVDWSLEKSLQWQGGTMDEANPFAGKHSFRVDDNDPHATVNAVWPPHLPVVNGKKYILQFAVRTGAAAQKYQVTLMCYGADNQWISGNNLDITREGNTAWQQVKIDVSQKLADPRVHFVSVAFRPTLWTADGAGIGTAWFDNVQLMENGSVDLLAGKGDFEAGGSAITPQVKMDFSAFDAGMEQAMEKYHLTTFRLGLHGVASGSGDTFVPGHIGDYKQGTAEYNALFGSYLRQLQDHLEQKGWLVKAYLYWFDEPSTSVYGKIREMGDLIHHYAPKLKWMLTEQPEKELEDSVDIWCSHLQYYDHATAVDLQKRGKEVWWYLCWSPKEPYVGEFIDHPGVEPRMWLWQTWKNKVQGILIWDTAYWTNAVVYPKSLQNPWQDTESWTDISSKLGNGDGRFFYPPNRDPNNNKAPIADAPINSTRWELLRDGVEDYEYFWTLQQQVDKLQQKKDLNNTEKTWLASAQNLLQVPDSISASLTSFSEDPNVLMARREQIAQAIVAGKVFLK